MRPAPPVTMYARGSSREARADAWNSELITGSAIFAAGLMNVETNPAMVEMVSSMAWSRGGKALSSRLEPLAAVERMPSSVQGWPH